MAAPYRPPHFWFPHSDSHLQYLLSVAIPQSPPTPYGFFNAPCGSPHSSRHPTSSLACCQSGCPEHITIPIKAWGVGPGYHIIAKTAVCRVVCPTQDCVLSYPVFWTLSPLSLQGFRAVRNIVLNPSSKHIASYDSARYVGKYGTLIELT